MLRSALASAAWTPSVYSSTGQTLVLLSAVPTSCTSTDIRSLAYKPPKPNARQQKAQSIPRDSSSVSLAASITSIEFVRTTLLNQSGRVVVRFRDPTRASEFAESANERVVGGNKIRARIVDRAPFVAHPVVSVLNSMQQQSPGRVVMIKGLPVHFTKGRVEKILSRSYGLAIDAKDAVDEEGKETTIPAVFEIRDITGQGQNYATNFLVRLQTVSSARMLVRRWHRAVWRNKMAERRGNDSDQSQFQSRDGGADENEFEEEEEEEKGKRASTSTNDFKEVYGENQYQNNDVASGRIIDAYLMY